MAMFGRFLSVRRLLTEARPNTGAGAESPGPRWYSSTVFRSACAYAAALSVLCFVAHDVSLVSLGATCKRARLGLFIPAGVFSVLCWLIGETFLLSRLFSYFHGRITFREMLPANAMQEFLQVVDVMTASLAIVGFVHRRKNVPFLAAGCTMLVQGIVDLQVIGWFALLTLPWALEIPVHIAWYYPAAIVMGTWMFALFWMTVSPYAGSGRWLYQRTSLQAFRNARPGHYLKLSLIRALIFGAQGFVLYFELLSFGVRAPLRDVFAVESANLLLAALPIAPANLGLRQALIVTALGAFGSKSSLLAASLGHSAVTIILRVFLGLLFAGSFLDMLEGPSPLTITATASLLPSTD